MRTHDGRLCAVNDALDVGTEWATVGVHAVEDVLVPIAEHSTANDVPCGVETGMCLVDPFAGLLAMGFVGPGADGRHHLVQVFLGVSDWPCMYSKISTPACGQLLDDVASLGHLTADGLLLADNQDAERRLGC